MAAVWTPDAIVEGGWLFVASINVLDEMAAGAGQRSRLLITHQILPLKLAPRGGV